MSRFSSFTRHYSLLSWGVSGGICPTSLSVSVMSDCHCLTCCSAVTPSWNTVHPVSLSARAHTVCMYGVWSVKCWLGLNCWYGICSKCGKKYLGLGTEEQQQRLSCQKTIWNVSLCETVNCFFFIFWLLYGLKGRYNMLLLDSSQPVFIM